MNKYFITVLYLCIHEVVGQCPVHCKAGQICENTDAGCEECEEGYRGHQCQHAVVCERPQLKNNSYISNSTNKDVYVYKDIISIYCTEGYGTLGKSTLWCRGNKTWSSEPPLCREYTCTRPTLPNVNTLIENPKEAYVAGEQMRLVCRPKHVIEGKSTVTCLANGSWGKTFPACTEEHEGSYLLIVIAVSAGVLYTFTALTTLLCCKMRRQKQEQNSKQIQAEAQRRRKTNTSVQTSNKISENSQVSKIEIHIGWKHEDKNHIKTTRQELTKVSVDKNLQLGEFKQRIINRYLGLEDQRHVLCQILTASGNSLPDCEGEITVDQYLKESRLQHAEFYLHTEEKRRGHIQLQDMENDNESSTDTLNTMATNGNRPITRLPVERGHRPCNGDNESSCMDCSSSFDISDRRIWTVDGQGYRQTNERRPTGGMTCRDRWFDNDEINRQTINRTRENYELPTMCTHYPESRYACGGGPRRHSSNSNGSVELQLTTSNQSENGNESLTDAVNTMTTNDNMQAICLPVESGRRHCNRYGESSCRDCSSSFDISDRRIWTVDQGYRQTNERRPTGGMTCRDRWFDNDEINRQTISRTRENYELPTMCTHYPESRYACGGGPRRHSSNSNGSVELQPTTNNQDAYTVPSNAFDDGRNTVFPEHISRRTARRGRNQSFLRSLDSPRQSLHTFLDVTTNTPDDNTHNSDTYNNTHGTGRSSSRSPRSAQTSINLEDGIIQSENVASDIPSIRHRDVSGSTSAISNSDTGQLSNERTTDLAALERPQQITTNFENENEQSSPLHHSVVQQDFAGFANDTSVQVIMSPLQRRDTYCFSLDSDSDDTNIQAAMHSSCSNTRLEKSSEDLLRSWIQSTRNEREYPRQQYTIDRDSLLKSALDVLKRPNFDFKEPFTVEFSGERGADFGGPKREFLSCLMREIADAILEGGDSKKWFIHSMAKLESKFFYHAAVSVALSLLHGGPGLPVMNKSMYKLILNQNVTLTLDDVVDPDVRNKITMFRDNIDNDKDPLDDWLIDQGLQPPFDASKRSNMTQQLLKNHLYCRVHKEITDFKEGLRFVGLLSIMEEHPEEMADFFTSRNGRLSFQKFKDLYEVKYSPRSSSNRQAENDTMDCFESFLRRCDRNTDGVSLEDVLSFWTGSRSVPPLGFDRAPKIKFVADNDSRDMHPFARTCGLVLELPRGIKDQCRMTRMMTTAVNPGTGFHCA